MSLSLKFSLLDEYYFDALDEEIMDMYAVLNHRTRGEVRERTDFMKTLDDTEFRKRFRLSKNAVVFLHSLIEEKIQPPTTRNNAISSMNRLLLTLQYYASGDFLFNTGGFAGVSESATSNIIWAVTDALARLAPQFIVNPSGAELNEIKQGFLEIADFPKIVGTIGTTHIRISNPGGADSDSYRNSEGHFSLKVQTLCDHKLKIRDIVARWPGSAPDSRILERSNLFSAMNQGLFGDGIFLGNSGYNMGVEFLLTPISNPTTDGERKYNEAHTSTTNTVVRQHRMWKKNWPVLGSTIRLHISKVEGIVVAAAVLHNLAIDMNEELEPCSSEEELDEDIDPSSTEPLSETDTDTFIRSKVVDWFSRDDRA